MHRGLLVRWVAVIAAVGLTSAETVAAEAGALRYRGQVGQTYAYDISIQAEQEDETDILQGVVSFTFQAGADDQLKVTYQGGLNRRSQPKPTQGGRGFGPPMGPFGPGRMGPGGFGPFASTPYTGTRVTTNQLILTPLGSIKSMEGDSQLPYLLGNASLLVFEPLPERAQPTWKVDSGVSITEGQARNGPPFFSPFHQQQAERTTAGSEGADYQIEREEGPLVYVKKTYRLNSPAADKNDSSAELTGSGTWVFNRELGVSESLNFQEQLVVHKGNTTTTIPVTIKYRRLSAEEMAKMQEESRKRQEELQKKMADARQKAEAPLDAAAKQKVLSNLASGNLPKVLESLRELEQKSPKDRDAEIEAALQPLLKHNNRSVQNLAEKAMAKWSPDFKKKAELNKAYQGPGFVGESKRPVGPETPLFPGQIVVANDTGAWYPAEVLDVLSDGQVQLEFRGWGSRRNKTLPRARLQLAPPEVDQPNLKPDQIAAIEAKPGSTANSTSAPRAMRTWSDDTGGFSVEAEYLGMAGDKIRLKRKDGREVSVPLKRLSAADQKFVEELLKPAATNPFEP